MSDPALPAATVDAPAAPVCRQRRRQPDKRQRLQSRRARSTRRGQIVFNRALLALQLQVQALLLPAQGQAGLSFAQSQWSRAHQGSAVAAQGALPVERAVEPQHGAAQARHRELHGAALARSPCLQAQTFEPDLRRGHHAGFELQAARGGGRRERQQGRRQGSEERN